MKIYKITEASEYLGVSINTLKTLANNGKVKSFKNRLQNIWGLYKYALVLVSNIDYNTVNKKGDI